MITRWERAEIHQDKSRYPKLLIDNKVVIDNDGQHATAAVTGSIFLTEGIHKIEIEYFQGPRVHVALTFEVHSPGSLFYSIFNKDDY